ncbi:hypothetical protein V9Z31_11020 [Streptococcus suis]|uniref:hypothetical protein n=1 Tax=Streptococcus suis TaxID=1307 RepID=UPI00301009E9
MKKTKTFTVLLLSSLLLSQSVTPVNVYALSNNYEVSEDISTYNSELLDFNIEIVNDTTVKIINSDGTVDIMERKSDGVYLNGTFYMPLLDTLPSGSTTLRSANTLNKWYYVGSSSGTAEGAANANGLAHTVIALLLGIGMPAIGTAYSILSAIISMISPSAPGAYYKTSLYVHPQNRQLKTVTSYYKNANYTGYVTTITRYSNF